MSMLRRIIDSIRAVIGSGLCDYDKFGSVQ
jgi:hypothetical protein